MLAIPDQIMFDGLRVNGRIAQKLVDGFDFPEISFAATSKSGNKFLDGNTGHDPPSRDWKLIVEQKSQSLPQINTEKCRLIKKLPAKRLDSHLKAYALKFSR